MAGRPIFFRVDPDVFETLEKKSLASHKTVPGYVKKLVESHCSNKDITKEEQSLLKDTVQLISVNLFKEIEKMISNFHTENKLENKNTVEEIKNIYGILNQLYQENN
jgi:GTP:adenosylcobinamide-phosphate guanylyltransferase